jgi:adenylylsulfate kinase
MQRKSGWCVWVTGLPGSGKSSVTRSLIDKLDRQGVYAQIVSSDMLRKVVTPAPTYSEDERGMVYGAIVFVAELLTRNGVNVVIDATSNRRKYRDDARSRMPRFMEAYLWCPLEVCIQRENKRKETFHAPKDIYRRGFTGGSATVPGVGVPYEEPLNPEVLVDTDKLDATACAEKILETLTKVFSTA